MLDMPLGIGFDTNTQVKVVQQVIIAALSVSPGTFPFRPSRGIDLDKYVFEYNSKQLKNLYLTDLADLIKVQDERIDKVFLDVNQDIDGQTNILTIHLALKNGENVTWNRSV